MTNFLTFSIALIMALALFGLSLRMVRVRRRERLRHQSFEDVRHVLSQLGITEFIESSAFGSWVVTAWGSIGRLPVHLEMWEGHHRLTRINVHFPRQIHHGINVTHKHRSVLSSRLFGLKPVELGLDILDQRFSFYSHDDEYLRNFMQTSDIEAELIALDETCDDLHIGDRQLYLRFDTILAPELVEQAFLRAIGIIEAIQRCVETIGPGERMTSEDYERAEAEIYSREPTELGGEPKGE